MITDDVMMRETLKAAFSKEEKADILRLARSSERLRITMTNDFAFQTVLRNKKVLKGLLSAILQIPAGEIEKIELVDPVVHGDFLGDKTGILDIRIHLNGSRKINIEMQVLPFPYWEERSLFYLCKMFVEDLKKGTGYGNLETCIHIGILKYNLFENSDFYSEIGLLDVKTGRLYSDKISLRVLQLNQLEKATEQQRKSELYLWAKMISADDWEVLEMLAKKNAYIGEAVKELEKINSDPVKRYEYLCREKKELDENTIRNYFMEIGRDEGIAKGEAKSEARYSRLILKLSEAGELDKIVRAASDPEFLDQLYLKYGI